MPTSWADARAAAIMRKRWFCPRAIYPWWREAWLEPIAEIRGTTAPGSGAGEAQRLHGEHKSSCPSG